MAKGRDAVDLLCCQWADVRRQLLGIANPRQSRDFLGAVRCAIGNVKDFRDGAGSRTQREQHFPEVYTGDAMLVNNAFKRMPPALRTMMDAHYVIDTPRDKRVRADLMGISAKKYWDGVRAAEVYVEGYLAAQQDRAA